MKITLVCMACAKDDEVFMKIPDESNSVLLEWTPANLQDNPLYEVTCSKGHKTVVVLQQQKFETLFDCGLLALADGYPREAISNIAASVERMYEFCLQVFCKKSGASDESYKAAWKLVSSQSERQLGAFYFAYLSAYGECPPSIKQNMVEFRNNVIHKGYIPSSTEAEDYAQNTVEFQFQVLKKIRETDETYVQQVVMANLVAASKPKKGEMVSTCGMPTTICLGLAIEKFIVPNVKEWLQSIRTGKFWLKAR